MPSVSTKGAVVHYQRAGTGPPVLLLQGVGLASEGWRPQIDGLADRFTLVAVDNRGVGGSTIADGQLTIEDMAADAIAVMDAEGFDRFHVVGHSMGGLIALAAALSAPHRVRSLALLCTFARGQDGTRLSLAMLVTALRTRIGSKVMRRNAFMELIMPARFLQETDRAALAARLAPLFGHDLAVQPPIAMKQLRAMAKYDASGRLPELAKIRTLVV